MLRSNLKPNLLCIVPPYLSMGAPPLGPAALLAHLRSQGCDDFDFLDLRLWVPNAYSPTYRPSGAFGETYIIDVPDLPLVLKLIDAFSQSTSFSLRMDTLFERYCLERGISAPFLFNYLHSMNHFLEAAFSRLDHLEFIGFSVWSSNLLTTLMATAHLKARRKPPLVVLGGPQVTESQSSAKLALRAGLADFVVLGEGEETLLQLFEAFRITKGVPSKSIPGTMRFNALTRHFEKVDRPLLRLSTLSIPAFDKMPLPAYWTKNHRLRTMTYELSRGCTDKCTFCSEWVFWKRMRMFDLQSTVDNFVELTRRFRAERIWFMDSLLNAKLSLLRDFATNLMERGIRVQWGGFMRANMDSETAALLKSAGCSFVFVGVESLSDETLMLMNKRRTEADNISAIRSLLSAGLRHVVAGFIPGFPGDTRDRFIRTALKLGEIRRDFPNTFRVNIEPFVISPAQPIYSNLSSYNLEPHGWSEDYLDLAPGFRELTNDILCNVTGSNQGLDRLGEFHIARTVTASHRRPTSPDPYFYGEGEDLASRSLEFAELEAGIYLGMAKSDAGLSYGLIITPNEKMEYEDRADLVTLNLADADGHSEGQFHLEPHEAFIKEIDDRHIVTTNRAIPRIMAGLYTPSLALVDELGLAPSAVARTLTDGGSAKICVADIVTLKHILLPIEAAPLISTLSVENRSLQDLLQMGHSGADYLAFLESLNNIGALRTTKVAL
jgi:radical SAM superfamily enzyme YgiQ (UPF0313 family)